MLSNSLNEGKRSSKRNVDSFGDTRKYNVGKTYAVIVGISNYQHYKWNLKYADRDAEELYQLLLTPSGGGIEERNVKKLINEQATTLGITKALRTFLKEPGKEDLVLLFFACHATPDEIRPPIFIYLHKIRMRMIYQELRYQ